MTAHGFAPNGRAIEVIMNYFTAQELAMKTGLQASHIWADVRSRGIEPAKRGYYYMLDENQLKEYLKRREEGYRVKRKGKPKPRKQQAEPVCLLPMVNKNGRSYLFAAPAHDVPQPWAWGFGD